MSIDKCDKCEKLQDRLNEMKLAYGRLLRISIEGGAINITSMEARTSRWLMGQDESEMLSKHR